ncbi:MAG: DUF1587 domain-containing protein, partial [Planctomycetaceae bacterium]
MPAIGSLRSFMTLVLCGLFSVCTLSPAVTIAADDPFAPEMMALIRSSCLDCHAASTATRLNLATLDRNLTHTDTFRQWEHIYDRLRLGEMPPASAEQPAPEAVDRALKSLQSSLLETNRRAQESLGRVTTRRLTQLEYEYSLHDLLGIRGNLARHLPPENGSSTFDTVAADQGISPVHVRSYLDAADIALDEAIQLGPQPRRQPVPIDYRHSPYTRMWVDRPLRNGGRTVKLVDDAWVTFETRPHVAQSN